MMFVLALTNLNWLDLTHLRTSSCVCIIYLYEIEITGLLNIFIPCHCVPDADDNIDETYGVNVQFESDEEVSLCTVLIVFYYWQ